ncbi:FtsH protease activity modulator HflK [Candidatus Caldatribacterium sp.]|uniref:FtsH protease activity modulator HflK n=1 Tax=Candidatus Caldatribacterium sp. TaxID=2282143 RepID=UPI002990FDA7|nr:FtsH protease activity modulator HflK [Candidatus Caldatribacterium sp.]MDW8080982.1 FtsH protease activity modulator HflK [Candidatus Calescibacterium sp.]
MYGESFEGRIIDISTVRFFRFFRRLGFYALGIVLLLYFVSGVYVVGPDEVGVVRRLGSYNRTVPPGIHYRLPYPFESVTKPKITEVRRVEIGFRTLSPGPPPKYALVPEESLMLTGDENIVSCQFIVQFRISDPYRYLFRIKDPEKAVKNAAEAALREVVGKKTIDEVLTTGRAEVQEETRMLLQDILDRYEAGIRVLAVQLQDVQPPQEVVAAFKDVASAREDKVRFVNEAEAYRNQILPQARGEAARIIQEAEAYRETVIRKAEGEVARFLAVLREYEANPDVTRRRLRLEVLEDVLPKVKKFVFDSEESLQHTLPFLPLSEGDADE